MITNAELIALIIRDGIPAALHIAEIARRPAADPVDPADLARLRQLASLTAEDYKRERQD